jgi:hypothetical protein
MRQLASPQQFLQHFLLHKCSQQKFTRQKLRTLGPLLLVVLSADDGPQEIQLP